MLFDLAQQIARTIAVSAANMSKTARGYALAHEALDKSMRAQSLKLGRGCCARHQTGRSRRRANGFLIKRDRLVTGASVSLYVMCV